MQRKWNIGTRHCPFSDELSGAFNGKLNGPFSAAFASFQLGDFFLNWSTCCCRYRAHVRAVKLVATFLATRCLYRRLLKMLKRLNGKSCISCKEVDHARVFCLAIVPLCLYFNKNFEIPRLLALMSSLRRSLDMSKARFPHRRSSKIRCLV